MVSGEGPPDEIFNNAKETRTTEFISLALCRNRQVEVQVSPIKALGGLK